MIRIELMKYVNEPLASAHVDPFRGGLVPNVINVHDARKLRDNSPDSVSKTMIVDGFLNSGEQTMVRFVQQHGEVCPGLR